MKKEYDMRTLTPEHIIASYPYTLWEKDASTRIKIIDEADIRKEASFLDLEGRDHEVKLGRCICVGSQGERWTCSVASLERDRYPITEPDAEGYREYKMKRPQALKCFDIPFAFALLHKGNWQCNEQHGGIVTWNGKEGDDLEMRVVARNAFLATYQQVKKLDQLVEAVKSTLAHELAAGRVNSLSALQESQARRATIDCAWQAIQTELQPIQQAIKALPALPDAEQIHWAQSVLAFRDLAFMEIDTTGLQNEDELIRFTLIDKWGQIIEDCLIKPVSRMLTSSVSTINGITPEQLEQEGLELPTAWKRIQLAVKGRYTISYGQDWDLKVLARTAARHTMEPLMIIGDDLQRHCTRYYQGEYYLKLAELCERVNNPLPDPPAQTSLDRANGQLAVLIGIADGVTDLRPANPQATTTTVDGINDDDDPLASLDEHPF